MTQYFDRYEWKPQLFRTPEELNAALEHFDVKDKKIKAIHTIGLAYHMEPWACRQKVFTTLAEVGISYDDIDSGRYPYIDKTLLPGCVTLCEPVVFVFEDDSTLEIKPEGNEGLLMAVNQIPISVCDGLNHSNIHSTAFFQRMIGCSIKEIWTKKTLIKTEYTCSGHGDEEKSTEWKIWMTGKYNLYFYHSWEGWYTFGMTSDYIGCYDGKLSYAAIKKAAKKYHQIPIVEGHDSSSYFWIMPVRAVEVTDDNWSGIEECVKHQISIEETHVAEFLYYFLDKYFDRDYPYGSARGEYCGTGFEWNLEYNIYTYEAMKQMQDEIERVSTLLQTNFEDPILTDIKKGFRWTTFDPDENRYMKKLTEAQKKQVIRDNIGIAADFYERFVRRMRQMMEYADDYALISFMGP